MAKQEKAENPFERKLGDSYFYIASHMGVYTTRDDGIDPDDMMFDTANYCHDKELMERRALHETLNRLLWRYSEMNGGGEKRGGHFIYLSYSGGMYVGHCSYACCGDVYFKTKAAAEAAIEEVVKPFMAAHPEFVW